MSKIQVTKARIIRAISKEPVLLPGDWVAPLVNKTISWETREAILDKLKIKSKECSVCAVGAIMRDVLNPNQRVEIISSASQCAVGEDTRYYADRSDFSNLKDLENIALSILNNGNPMAALSFLFEGFGEWYLDKDDNLSFKDKCKKKLTGRQIASIRRRVIAFVKKNFPANVIININGAEPAKDVKKV